MQTDIFSYVNAASEAKMVALLGLAKSKDGRGYICPICEKGKGGDGLKFNPKPKLPLRYWECYGACRRSYNNVALIANLERISDKAELAKRLRELFGQETSSFQREKKTSPAKAKVEHVQPTEKRNFAGTYSMWRKKYSLKEFLDLRGGSWRGLTYETLSAAGCIYHPEYLIAKNQKAPVMIIPYDDELYIWREVDGHGRGVPKDVKRKPYILRPLAFVNFIVEGEIDALSISQAFREPGFGIIAAGSVTNWRRVVSEIERSCKSKDEHYFIVLPDNDSAGAKFGEDMTDSLKGRGFNVGQYFFGCRYEPKIDANDLLQQGGSVLYNRLWEAITATGM